MAIANDALIIGLTGSFGSGCSTLREALADKGYKDIALSKFVRQRWQELNPKKPLESATRQELQDIGNHFRKESNNNAILALNAINEIMSADEQYNMIVFDSIRHPDEISALRKPSRNFFLVALGCSLTERWNRLSKEYESKKLILRNFQEDDERDALEDIGYGQRVQLCVDNADISIRNERHFTPKHKQKEELIKTIDPYLKNVTGEEIRPPTPDESMMAMAYTKALSSSCYKRQVGAVIVDENGSVLGVGCNENPQPIGPCYEEYGECYRDLYKKEFFDSLKGTRCPKCNNILDNDLSPGYKCKNCGFNLDKYYIKDRAISRCTALHAEEAAIINVGGRNLKGCTMYTTTFPCFLCAQKIIGSGIRKVVYCEAYPDPDAALLFEDVNKKNGAPFIQVYNFQGVKARAYFRVFGTWRKEMEKIIDKKKGVA